MKIEEVLEEMKMAGRCYTKVDSMKINVWVAQIQRCLDADGDNRISEREGCCGGNKCTSGEERNPVQCGNSCRKCEQ